MPETVLQDTENLTESISTVISEPKQELKVATIFPAKNEEIKYGRLHLQGNVKI